MSQSHIYYDLPTSKAVAGGSDAIVVMSDEGVNREPRVRIDVAHVVHVSQA